MMQKKPRERATAGHSRRCGDQRDNDQMQLRFIETEGAAKHYEYAVPVTSLSDKVLTIFQHYRDRADAEYNFDELKNRWGWGGFTKKDLKHSRLMARIVVLLYNWRLLSVRLARPDKHLEAITSRPMLLHAIGKQMNHGRQITVSLTSAHVKAGMIQRTLTMVTRFFQMLKETAEQLTQADRWRLILSRVFIKRLDGRSLQTHELLPKPV